MILEKMINEEFIKVKKKYPKLGCPKKGKYGFTIAGDIDLVDPYNGRIWETYKVRLEILNGYPLLVPSIFETGNKIQKNNHIDEHRKCCLATRLEEILILGRSYMLIDYIDKLVIPFFASQKLMELGQGDGIGGYSHYGEGLIEYYKKKLNTSDINIVLKVLNILSNKLKINRNESCFCGCNKKYKHCHEISLFEFARIDRRIFLEDIKDIKKALS